MKALLFLLTLSFGSASLAARPVLPGTVPGLSIGNSHIVSVQPTASGDAKVVRGMAPTEKQIAELLNFGITDVLIFKNETGNEVQEEKMDLVKMGFDPKNITHIPFPWKDIYNFKSACRMTIQALRTIENAVQKGRSIYFHCTVGEDRTGYLASLWTLWNGNYSSVRASFQQEMCARGYEAGNPNKPFDSVVSKVRETLTPTYLKMISVLSKARTANQDLNESLCDQEPELQYNVQEFYCSSSR